MGGRGLRLMALAVLGALGASGCSTSGLAFREDDRLSIEGLDDRSEIELPHPLELRFDGELGPDGAAALAVLVNWTPPPPGETLESLLEDDPACGGTAGCPDGYLERNRITVTDPGPFELFNVPVGTDRQERRGYHELTVVLVDADGRRVGETSAFARFRVPGFDR